MSDTTNRTVVRVEIFSKDGRESEVVVGRLLGMVTDDQFHAIVSDKSLANRLSTVQTKTLSEVANLKDIANMRLALVIKNRNGKIINRKQMFFSEPLDMVSSISTSSPTSSSTSVSVNGKKGSYMIINEYIKGAEEATT